jgi:hypothetical protein
MGALLARKGQPLPLSQFETKEELIAEYKALLPDLPRDVMRRIRGEQDLIVEFEREKAIETLPLLLSDAADRDRLLEFFQRLLGDRRMQQIEPSAEQRATLARVKAAFDASPARPRLAAVPK